MFWRSERIVSVSSRNRSITSRKEVEMNRRQMLGKTAACATLVATAGYVSAQEKTNKPADNRPHYRAKEIIGANVQIEGDQAVGTIDDIVLDSDGNVDYLIAVN